MTTGPVTDIEIMSLAAMECGQQGFSSLDAGGQFALVGQAFLDMVAPTQLAQPQWRFNVKTVQLQLIANFNPDFWIYQFAWQLPSDYLSLQRLDPIIEYQIFGDQIWTPSSSPLKLAYRYQVPVSEWPSYFKECMVLELARKYAKTICQNDKLYRDILVELNEKRALAMFIDAQSHPNEGIVSKPWLTVRW